MRELPYTDNDGRKQIVELPDSAPDSDAYKGILVGPPDLFELHLPSKIEIRLNNALYDRGLIRPRDVKGRELEVFATLQSVFKVDVTSIINMYKYSEK